MSATENAYSRDAILTGLMIPRPPHRTGSSRNLSNQNIFVFIFFSNKGSFLHLFNSLGSRIDSNFIGLCLAIRITFVLKKTKMTEI